MRLFRCLAPLFQAGVNPREDLEAPGGSGIPSGAITSNEPMTVNDITDDETEEIRTPVEPFFLAVVSVITDGIRPIGWQANFF